MDPRTLVGLKSRLASNDWSPLFAYIFGMTDNPSLADSEVIKLAAATLSGGILESELYAVENTVSDLISHAATSLEPDFLHEDDVPGIVGVIALEDPISVHPKTAQEPIKVRFITWLRVYEDNAIFFLFLSEETRPVFFDRWELNLAWREVRDEGDASVFIGQELPKDAVSLRLWLLSFLRFIKQEIISGEPLPTDALDRATRRRAAKKGIDVGKVLIVRLRRQNKHKDQTSGKDVDWSCRWVVHGHWRNQWCASKQRHERIWISPYIKGPDDRPLVVKEKIFDVCR